MAKKSKWKKYLTFIWGKITHNWSWFDSIVSGGLFLVLGYMLGWAAATNQSLQFTNETLTYVMKMWAVFLFTGRGWQIARYPRPDPVKLKDLNGWAVLHLNYVSWFHFAIAAVFVYSLSPEIGELVHAWRNGK